MLSKKIINPIGIVTEKIAVQKKINIKDFQNCVTIFPIRMAEQFLTRYIEPPIEHFSQV